MRVAVFLSDEAKNLCIAELRKYFLTKYGEKIAFHKMCRLYVFRYLKETYGAPDTYFELGQGSWLIYNDCKIIFQLDADGQHVRRSIFNHKL